MSDSPDRDPHHGGPGSVEGSQQEELERTVGRAAIGAGKFFFVIAFFVWGPMVARDFGASVGYAMLVTLGAWFLTWLVIWKTTEFNERFERNFDLAAAVFFFAMFALFFFHVVRH